MKIERAIREKTFTLTSIAGPSGSGKTYSALLYARGLVGLGGKIGFIDTENKRSRFYADVAGGFDVIDLDPPFTSARYVEAIKTFEKAGYTAIVVDSISHEWEGSGGVLEQAEAIEERTKRAGLHCWQKPKAAHKKLMNELLQTRSHLIFCCRVKEKVVQTKGKDGKAEIVNEGFVVVQEKSFIYEMTVSMMLEEGTHVPLLQKCPGDLLSAFPQGSRITTKIGDAVREWSDKGEAVDEEFEALKREGLLVAAKGMKEILAWWKSIGIAKQERLAAFKDTLKSVAYAYDQMSDDQIDAGAGDPGTRLQHAKDRQQNDEGSSEGFDLDAVTRQTQSFSNTNPDDTTPSSVDAGEPRTPAETGDSSPPSPVSTSLDPALRTHLIDFARKASKTVQDEHLANEAKVKSIDDMLLNYREVVPEQEWGKLSTIKISLQAVLAGKRSIDQARKFIATDLLDCRPDEIGGAA